MMMMMMIEVDESRQIYVNFFRCMCKGFRFNDVNNARYHLTFLFLFVFVFVLPLALVGVIVIFLFNVL